MLIDVRANLAASDVERARRWYEEKLGLKPYESWPDELLRFRVGPSSFSIYKTASAGTAKNTVAVFDVADLRAEVAAMRARGVVFEEYDFGGGDKTVDGIIESDDGGLNAWFTDSEGNVLALAQLPAVVR
jgi:predicted enzyme related to lactoylglutathione lyase